MGEGGGRWISFSLNGGFEPILHIRQGAANDRFQSPFAAGTGNPFFTTDTAAALRATLEATPACAG